MAILDMPIFDTHSLSELKIINIIAPSVPFGTFGRQRAQMAVGKAKQGKACVPARCAGSGLKNAAGGLCEIGLMQNGRFGRWAKKVSIALKLRFCFAEMRPWLAGYRFKKFGWTGDLNRERAT
ncbi:hypothetical protein H9Q10_09960 [Eikenella sp. S3360]|uniref:Uncharacterized protein n=1 Tax=Eikenella glucosivorans TaxID=2766967 RepID=A0ABS0NCD8_9NEIS|nr:hypothetical protein [Eikenella glucosivorans]MBH5329985.1 hypothetical protein [Eikenella glucosivorans]